MTKTFPAALVALLLATTACGGTPSLGGSDPAPADAQAAGNGTPGEGGEEDEMPGSEGRKDGVKGQKGDPGGDTIGSNPGTAGNSPQAVSRVGRSSVVDAMGDAEGQGQVPAWVDLTGGMLVDSGPALKAMASFAAALPARMPDNRTVATNGIQLLLPKDKKAYLYAEGGPQGWKAYLVRNKTSALPPGAFSLNGTEMHWSVPWAELGNPTRIDWGLHLSWTRTTLLKVDYAFDSAPDSGMERLRRR